MTASAPGLSRDDPPQEDLAAIEHFRALLAIADPVRRQQALLVNDIAANPESWASTIRDLVTQRDDARRELAELRRSPRDEHHTMAEVYDYRMLYNALAVNAWAEHGTHPVVKSWTHSDGEPCFGGGWFIVVATLPTGQVSNHYRAEHWDLFAIPEVVPPAYDGHTPAVAAERMREHLQG